MTRFARAKGSKASNERIPGDGTPWDVMKEQFLQAQKKGNDAKFQEEAEKKRIENYENFLKEQKILKRKSVWCEFEDGEAIKSQSINETQDTEHTIKKKKKHNSEKQNLNVDNKNENSNVAKINSKAKSNKMESDQIEEQKIETKKKLKRDQNIKLNQDDENPIKGDKIKFQNKKDKKRNIQLQSLGHQSQDTQNDEPFQVDRQSSLNKNKRKGKNLLLRSGSKDESDELQNNPAPEKGNGVESKHLAKTNIKNKKKMVNGKPARRKVLNDKSFKLIINGKDVQLVRFDGFPIMKKDAERLEDLKKNMIKKGIPKSEVQRTMKLERRRAEKALARIKRDVCYNCRKGGHNLSDCPDLKSKIPGVDGADGLCFKCGSTEHRQFECKVQKDKEFRFATCFICKEPGHIARQCPDNPKGLYPNGGCCKLCGDVTHLRKDCPSVQDKKEGASVKLNTLDATDNIEEIGGHTRQDSVTEPTKKPKKIKF